MRRALGQGNTHKLTAEQLDEEKERPVAAIKVDERSQLWSNAQKNRHASPER